MTAKDARIAELEELLNARWETAERVATLEARIAELEAEVNDYSNESDALEAEVARLRERVTELEADCANWERTAVQTTMELGARIAELEELLNARWETAERVAELEAAVEDAKDNAVAWFEAKRKAEARAEARIAELEACANAEAQLANEYHARIAELEAERDALQRVFGEAGRAAIRNRAEAARLRDDLRSMQERNRSLLEALERADDTLSLNATDRIVLARRIIREALAGGGQEPSTYRCAKCGMNEVCDDPDCPGRDEPVYPRGLDGSDGLEDGHWAVDVGERGEQTGATWESCQ